MRAKSVESVRRFLLEKSVESVPALFNRKVCRAALKINGAQTADRLKKENHPIGLRDCGTMVNLIGLQVLEKDLTAEIPTDSFERRQLVCEVTRAEKEREHPASTHFDTDANFNSTTLESIQSNVQINREVYRNLDYLDCTSLLI